MNPRIYNRLRKRLICIHYEIRVFIRVFVHNLLAETKKKRALPKKIFQPTHNIYMGSVV